MLSTSKPGTTFHGAACRFLSQGSDSVLLFPDGGARDSDMMLPMPEVLSGALALACATKQALHKTEPEQQYAPFET